MSRIRGARRYLLGEVKRSGALRASNRTTSPTGECFRTHGGRGGEHLIEDYLAERLDSAERSLFERSDLRDPASTPARRKRRGLDVRCRKRAAPVRTATPARAITWASLAAAALIVLAVGGWWILHPTSTDVPTVLETTRLTGARPLSLAPVGATPPTPRILAFSISPITLYAVREAAPASSSRQELTSSACNSRGRPVSAPVDRPRARVRTVTGVPSVARPRGGCLERRARRHQRGRIDVPASRLSVDDYVIELFGIDASGAEHERARYFLAVRPR